MGRTQSCPILIVWEGANGVAQRRQNVTYLWSSTSMMATRKGRPFDHASPTRGILLAGQGDEFAADQLPCAKDFDLAVSFGALGRFLPAERPASTAAAVLTGIAVWDAIREWKQRAPDQLEQHTV
jgi:hypothetical protein